MIAQPILDHAPGWHSRYEPHEDTTIIQMVRENRLPGHIAKRLGRSSKSVQRRIDVLRREGSLTAYNPIRRALQEEKAVTMAPPLTLRDDDALVAAVLAEGGFPRAVATAYGAAWAGPDGKPWRHREVQMRRAA